MVSRICVYVVLMLLARLVLAQVDTVRLDEVTISALHFERFTTGSQLESISYESAATLDEALSQVSNIYFKSYGNGQLSTISFRGTSASQTSVLWHGVPANYPTLGQMDFSQWPTWMMDQLQVSAGANASLYGSGAIGGSVLVDSDVAIKSTGASFLIGVGSFGEFETGIKATYGSDRFKAHTNFYCSFLQNDFQYEYNGETLRQNNASSLMKGVKQQLSYSTLKGTNLFADFQYTVNDREIQPTKSAPTSEDELLTKNTRLAFGANQEWSSSSLNITLAYLQNDQVYNETDQTTGNQYSSIISYWYQLNEQLEFRVGGNTNLFTASSESYLDKFNDLQVDAFTSVSARPIGCWQSVLNLRQSFYADQSPFVPSWSNQFKLLQSKKWSLLLNESFSYGFRYPTLNDLHWTPGGNPELKPEESENLDADLEVKYKPGDHQILMSIGGYKTWSSDWIVWLPTAAGYWAPQNFRQVEINGLETTLKVSGKVYSFIGSYTFNQSTNQTGSNIGNMLPYSPVHNGRIHWMHQLKKLGKYSLQGLYTGKRYTTLDNTARSSVAPFFILDVTLGREFELPFMDFSLSASINNVLDANYENLNNRAMPGRNYQLQLNINYNNR